MLMIGIDVGGTNTDAALLSEDKHVLATAKVPTNHQDPLTSTHTVLEKILADVSNNQPVQLHLSTTLSTNAIIEGKGEPTAVIAIPGPGINLANYGFDFPVYTVQGYIDHRGRLVRDVDKEEVLAAAKKAKVNGAQSLAVVSKFSPRNSQLETGVRDIILESGPEFHQITLGHKLSGSLNFPRRIMSAYLNTRVASQQIEFVKMLKAVIASYPNITDVRILKADGGTMTLDDSCVKPIETILSGPAASLNAALALSQYTQDNVVVVDIGGTTTDIAVVVGGKALYQRGGAVIGNYHTLVPALLTCSIGLGGDSEIHFINNQIEIGPKRAGMAICCGGEQLTPTDAAVALELTRLGDRSRAIAALEQIAYKFSLTWKELAQLIINAFTQQLSQAIDCLYHKLKQVPVYTVSEILAPPDIRPRVMVGLGGPAPVFIPLTAKRLGLPWEILPEHESANGIGAAAACSTVAITLHVDTEQELMVIPELGYKEQLCQKMLIDQPWVRKTAVEKLTAYASQIGLNDCGDVQIVEEEAFNIVRGFNTTGRIFNIRAQIRPGVYRVAGDSNC